MQTKNGYIKRVYDEDIKSLVLEIMGSNVSTTFVHCPSDCKAELGIKLPFLVLLIKNMHKYFCFEVKVRLQNYMQCEVRSDSKSVCRSRTISALCAASVYRTSRAKHL